MPYWLIATFSGQEEIAAEPLRAIILRPIVIKKPAVLFYLIPVFMLQFLVIQDNRGLIDLRAINIYSLQA